MARVDPVELARKLIACPSVTPADAGALGVLEDELEALGFRCERMPFEEPGAAPVDNLYARWGDGSPHFCFAGHTDVVPPGPEEDWRAPPFAAVVAEGALWGRGAADMKGAIAAFVGAASRLLEGRAHGPGSVSLLITGDEEGPAINGTKKMLAALAARGETIDHSLVGEPTSRDALGDMMKVGRRGSINCWLTVFGAAGHVAYPHRAQNPIPGFLKKLLTLAEAPLDDGYDRFEPSSLQITDIHVGNAAHNVIPPKATARFNVRFNPNWTGASLEAALRERLDAAAAQTGLAYDLSCVVSGEAFLTEDDAFLDLVSAAVEAHTGRRPERSTSGGTSDARFIRDHAPVCEFGLVGATMHKTDERVSVDDIATLADVYATLLERYLARAAQAAA
ncbi:MAG: succinyl-diaminopimelate desuccinylase [Parvularculaceae bacterium]